MSKASHRHRVQGVSHFKPARHSGSSGSRRVRPSQAISKQDHPYLARARKEPGCVGRTRRTHATARATCSPSGNVAHTFATRWRWEAFDMDTRQLQRIGSLLFCCSLLAPAARTVEQNPAVEQNPRQHCRLSNR